MSGEILQDFSCEFIHEGDSCKLVDFFVDENRKLRAARDAWAENDAKLRELVRDMMRYYFMPSAIDSKQRETELLERAHELGVAEDNGELGMEVMGVDG